MPWFSLGDVDPEELKRVMEEARRKTDETLHDELLRHTETPRLHQNMPCWTEPLCKPLVDKRRAAEIDGGE